MDIERPQQMGYSQVTQQNNYMSNKPNQNYSSVTYQQQQGSQYNNGYGGQFQHNQSQVSTVVQNQSQYQQPAYQYNQYNNNMAANRSAVDGGDRLNQYRTNYQTPDPRQNQGPDPRMNQGPLQFNRPNPYKPQSHKQMIP